MFIKLSKFGCIRVTGPDAKKFLQGQLTCNIDLLLPGTNCMGAHCNPQGRVISLFYLVNRQDHYYLLMLRSLVPLALTALKKYAVFFKAELTDASETIGVIGHTNDYIPALKDAAQIRLSDTRSLTLADNLVVANYEPKSTDQAAWELADIHEQIPFIYPETSGLFLPHDLNLDKLNAIHFDKGCYTGQEIIARMHYRGKRKNHLSYARIASERSPQLGADIYALHDETKRMIGSLVNAVKTNASYYDALIITPEFIENSDVLFSIR